MLSIFSHERYYSSPFHVRVGKSGLLHLAHLLSGDVSQVHFICNLCCGCRRSLLQFWSLFFIFSLRCCRHKLFDYLAHVRLVFSLLLSADFSFYRQFYLWNVDAILFQAELPSFVKAAVGSRLALCPLATVVFYPHSIILQWWKRGGTCSRSMDWFNSSRLSLSTCFSAGPWCDGREVDSARRKP